MLKNVKELEIIAHPGTEGATEYKLVAVDGGFDIISLSSGVNFGFRAIENCERWIKDGTWIIKEFNFHVGRRTEEIYKATFVQDRKRYKVTWDFTRAGKEGMYYFIDKTLELVHTGAWLIVEPTIEPVDPVVSPVKGIKIGDNVVITDTGAQYIGYSEWVDRNKVGGYVYGAMVEVGTVGIVVAQAFHGDDAARFIIAVQDSLGQTFLVEERGVEVYVEPIPNGFDADNNPLNFEESDLQVGQRVQVREGGMYVVMPNVQDGGPEQLVLVRVGGWTTWDDGEDCPEYAPVAVFEAPIYNQDLLDVTEKGKLLWVSKDNTHYLRKMQLQADIAEARSNLNNLEEALESLA